MSNKQLDRSGAIIIKICIFSIVLSITALVLSFIFHKWIYQDKYTVNQEHIFPTIIMDAGHGGEDGGAISNTGIKEKDLNLSIALKVGEILQLQGYNIIHTRTEDKMLYTTKNNGSLKMQDLRNRLKVAEENENSIFVSIHMNKFSEEKYSGLQTFYSPNNTESKQLAEKIQSNTKKYLQTDNYREIKQATSGIFLLDKNHSTAILIECGFLSNTNECDRLCNEQYQDQLSCVISQSIIEFLQNS